MLNPVYINNLNEIVAINPYNFVRLDEDIILITTYTGNYIYLTNEEFKKFRVFDWDEELYKKLVDKGIVITKENQKKLVYNLFHEIVRGRLCRFFVFSITRRCNQACLYCHAGSSELNLNSSKYDMDETTAKKMLEFIGEIPYKKGERITLVTEGGEPLIKFDLLQFIYDEKKKIEKDRKINIHLTLATNLTLMDEDIANTFMKWTKNRDFSFCSSLEGPKKLHDKVRPFKNGSGTYETVVYWIEYFKKMGHTVPLMSTITKYHIELCTPRELLEEYYKLGQRHYFFKIFRPSGTGLKKINKLRAEPEALAKYWIEMIEESIKMYKEGKPISERITNIFVTNIESPARISMCYRRPCGAGFDIISFDESGNVIGCDSLRSISHRHTLGKLGIDNYYSILNKALGMYFGKSIKENNIICQTCPFLPYCNICFAEPYGFSRNTWYIESKKYCIPNYKILKYLFFLKYKQPEKYKILVEYAKRYNRSSCKLPSY